jgi:very-short-patch-repair endonuclease
VDFAWPELRVALEYDGYQTEEIDHVMATARNNDLRRQGWLVVRADAQDLAEPTALCGRLRAACHTHTRIAA